MPKVLYLTTAAGPDGVIHAGSVRNVSPAAAKELVAGGFARAVTADEDTASRASERATGRRGASQAVAGPDEEE